MNRLRNRITLQHPKEMQKEGDTRVSVKYYTVKQSILRYEL